MTDRTAEIDRLMALVDEFSDTLLVAYRRAPCVPKRKGK